ncbi:MAG: chloride channel protein, partial [Bdellovibrionales bacterium]|nr:chloride channel protein [Bdellovibrionales bacterium]
LTITFICILVGVIGALASHLFLLLIGLSSDLFLDLLAGYHQLDTVAEGGMAQSFGGMGTWLIPLSTMLGGLLSGYLVYSFAPEAEGHGTDATIRSFHRLGGSVRARVPFVKALASAVTIGSGGAAGREGPVAQIAAGIASLIGSWFKLTVPNRRIILLAGMAAGISASFKSPLGAALFTVEVLYGTFEFESGVLGYCIIASSVAYAVNGFFSGWTPIFQIPSGIVFDRSMDLFWYALLGLLCGIMSSVLPLIFYRTQSFFQKLSLPPPLKPALGGLLVGLIALFAPQVLGGGYGWMEKALNAELPLGLLLMLGVLKIFALSFTIGSGGSGGVFAPVLYIGTMFGAAFALIVGSWFPYVAGGPNPHGMAVVGMAALFAGAARVPIAALIMTAELTGGYGLIVPTMFAVTISFMVESGITRRWRAEPTLYKAQVPSRADSPTHQQEYVEMGLNLLQGGEVAMPGNITLPNLTTFLQFGKPLPLGKSGDFLYTVEVPERSAVIGKTVKEVRFIDKILISAIIRENVTITPRGASTLEGGDQLIVICKPEDLPSLIAELEESPGEDSAD